MEAENVKYGILNEFREQVQNSVRDSELSHIITRQWALVSSHFLNFKTSFKSNDSFLASMPENPKNHPNFFKFRRKHTKLGFKT